jgi:glycosyltransferase involved in cell wall biosynthesis
MSGRGRITVVRIIDRLNVGGPAIHAVLTSRGLNPERFRSILVHGSIEPGEADMGYLLEGSGVETVVIPSLGRELRPVQDSSTLFALWRLLRRERPQVVHTHKAKAGALGRVAALAAGVPVRVHTFHGHVFHGYFSPSKTRAFLAIERALASRTSRLVALSDGLADELSQRYRVAARDRFAIVPLGFDLSPFAGADQHRGELRRALGLPATSRLVGIVGRMVPVKDHLGFVAAAALLAARHADLRFVFVGGGELETQVRQAVAARGLDGRAHFLGWRRDLPRIYADLDLVALSSLNEGTPVTLIEAMASGVPVAATAVGGVPDLLAGGSYGEIAPPGDAVALAAAIERGLTDDSRARARRHRTEILRRFGSERLCSDLARLYVGLLAEAGLGKSFDLGPAERIG